MTDEQEYKMEQAVQLYNNNCDMQNMMQLNNIMTALRKFISLNKTFYDREDAILPRIYSFIALCNYKMGNVDRAYWCAKKSVELGETAMENSPFVASTNLFLDPEVFALLEHLKENYADEIDFSRGYQEGEENIFDDSVIRRMQEKHNSSNDRVPSENQIKGLVEALSAVQNQGAQYFNSQGDGAQAFQYRQLIDMFKMPLYCAWQVYKYGWHTDFLKEGDSLLPYMMFEVKAQETIAELIEYLRTSSPFALLERDGVITNALLSIYQKLLSDLKTGKVELK